MTDATRPDDADEAPEAVDVVDGEDAPPPDRRFQPEGDVEGILRASPAEGPEAGQESWVDDDPARTSGG